MILDEIVTEKRRAQAARDPARSEQRRNEAEALVRSSRGVRDERVFERALVASTPSSMPRVIAEYKRRSPSAGPIGVGTPVADVARAYVDAGAAAISILTDGAFFGGSLTDLAVVRAALGASGAPILRKDFLLFHDDLVDAKLAGADAVLVIARLMPGGALPKMLWAAEQLALEVLVEAHTEDEVRRACDCGARIVGVNHRDLDTLEIDLGLSERVAPLLTPETIVRVAESGLRTSRDLAEMAARGYQAVLVGEALLATPSPGDALRALLAGAS